MRTQKQIDASRRNGAASRGPVTQAGKLISAGNSCRHGLYSKTIQLPPDRGSEAEVSALRAELEGQYRPRTLAGHALAHVAASSYWNLRRVWALETRVFNNEIARQRLLHPREQTPILTALAFTRLCDKTTKFEALYGFEKQFLRHYLRAMYALERLCARRKFRGTNPTQRSGVENFAERT